MSSGYSVKKQIECICPRCDRKHKMSLFWTGKLPPRKLCINCKEISLSLDEEVNSSPTSIKSSIINIGKSYPLDPDSRARDLEYEF